MLIKIMRVEWAGNNGQFNLIFFQLFKNIVIGKFLHIDSYFWEGFMKNSIEEFCGSGSARKKNVGLNVGIMSV